MLQRFLLLRKTCLGNRNSALQMFVLYDGLKQQYLINTQLAPNCLIHLGDLAWEHDLKSNTII